MKYFVYSVLTIFGLAQGSLRAEEKALYSRILFLGDSITQHAPKENLGWSGTWGMAASSQDKDYVHQFLARLDKIQNGATPTVWIAAEGGGKVTDKIPLIPHLSDFHADLAVIQLGENDNQDVSENGFQKPYGQLLQAIREGNPKARILCFGVWGPPKGNPIKDAMIREECRKYGASFVDMRSVNAENANRAATEKLFSHPGVAWHPGDRGMSAYAEALWRVFSNPSTADEASVTEVALAHKAILLEERWGDPLLLSWKKSPPVEEKDGKVTANISVPSPSQDAMYLASLDAAELRGQSLIVRTRVKGEGISEKPKAWNGIKLMFRVKDAEGQINYPQYKLQTGTFDWMPIEWAIRIPDNAIIVDLSIGLEQVSGTVWFDAIQISTQR